MEIFFWTLEFFKLGIIAVGGISPPFLGYFTLPEFPHLKIRKTLWNENGHRKFRLVQFDCEGRDRVVCVYAVRACLQFYG
jgi:hypothetical protein